MYQSEVKPKPGNTAVHLVGGPPPPPPPPPPPQPPSQAPISASLSPENSSSSSSVATYHMAVTSAGLPNSHFHTTDGFQQLPNIPEAWMPPSSFATPPQHHQTSWEPVNSSAPSSYYNPSNLASSNSKQKRNQMLIGPGYKRQVKSSFRGYGPEEGEDACRLSNGNVSPLDVGGLLVEGSNGSSNPIATGGAASGVTTKRCRVCGDRAVNHNFGQLTCESCKAFFRRNAHKDLTCTSKSGEHVVSPSTRRECPACRLKRCFLIGMRPDLIQVRKKDGTKPRWLDKYPAAAQVHEHHVSRSDVSKMPRLSQSSPQQQEGSHRDPYATGAVAAEAMYQPRYPDNAHHQMMKAYGPYPTDSTAYSANAQLPTQNTVSGLYEENGRDLSGMLTGLEMLDPGFQVKTEVASPQYRTSDCVVLTNPLSDENVRQKAASAAVSSSTSWNQGVPSNFVPQIPNNSSPSPWIHSLYNCTTSAGPTSDTASHFATTSTNDDMLLLDSFNPHLPQNHQPHQHHHHQQHSLLSGLQTQERQNFAPLDIFGRPATTNAAAAATESRSGASSGSTTSPSVVSLTAPSFSGGGGVDLASQNGNFEAMQVKSEWTETRDVPVSGTNYLQGVSRSFRNKTFSSMTSDSSAALIFIPEADQWFSRLAASWKAAWRDGVFPNPSQVRVNLDLDAQTPGSASSEMGDWCLDLANIWSDLLTRRVADFASRLFRTTQNEVLVDLQISAALMEWIFKKRLVNCVPIVLSRALLKEESASPRPKNNSDDGGSSPRSPGTQTGIGLSNMSPRTNEKSQTLTTSIVFRVEPNQRVVLGLSRLSSELAGNPFTSVYPMLQYLDAYICELTKFLTEQILLLGAYMAVKLTEPPTTEELVKNPLSDADVAHIRRLHEKLVHLFGMATDYVASSIINGNPSEALQGQTKAMNDAICRRTKLPDFISWGRQFDENMKCFLFDVWSAKRHLPNTYISPCLTPIFSDTDQSLITLLTEPSLGAL